MLFCELPDRKHDFIEYLAFVLGVGGDGEIRIRDILTDMLHEDTEHVYGGILRMDILGSQFHPVYVYPPLYSIEQDALLFIFDDLFVVPAIGSAPGVREPCVSLLRVERIGFF